MVENLSGVQVGLNPKLPSNAVQMLVSADEELTVVDSGGSVGFLRDFVLCDNFKFLAWFDHGQVSFVGEEVGKSICRK